MVLSHLEGLLEVGSRWAAEKEDNHLVLGDSPGKTSIGSRTEAWSCNL